MSPNWLLEIHATSPNLCTVILQAIFLSNIKHIKVISLSQLAVNILIKQAQYKSVTNIITGVEDPTSNAEM